MGSFVRKVKTASGATAVQIVHKRGKQRLGIDHIGSAHDQAELELLLQVARERLALGQDQLDLGWEPAGRPPGQAVVESTASTVLWEALVGVYDHLGFDVLADECFRQLVLARVVEPTSKADSIRVLEGLGITPASLRTITRALPRINKGDYRDQLATACWSHVSAHGAVALVMYDVTTLYFEAENEDSLRKVGMSKERRVDPQITVGLLVDPSGFPLDLHVFEGNKAETTTLLPVIEAFQARHQVSDLVVVADAGMLSAANLNALEDAGFSFIVAARQSKAPAELEDHFEAHGNYLADGATFEVTRPMGVGKDRRDRRVVWHYLAARARRDQQTLNKQIERAEKIATGKAPIGKHRFIKLEGATKGVDWPLVERARAAAGFKGYVSNIPAVTLDGPAVVAAYRDLWHVEASFRMAKSDLAARPIFHHTRDSIEAHLTVVFAALAIARTIQARTGVSVKKFLQILRPLHSAVINTGTQTITIPPAIPPDAQEILDTLQGGH
ncbi:IS1634 family transposase [Raineyella sp. LH-20]|uniref:IS1634 family transposase n=1 Tax=Raineyella sp. LH-20 TaxID=3081204 RepID=UPI002952E88E|nr:IS1634 family transposase [Raineyella sp. LH-20]WOP17466.1 IS1634 family transposase [Raineyella sp. LH-20]WOP19686.1 IS1634 family transposase [Raineyella sp. LH-20]WOP19951.1 IS1634 family transposase [Raineyella sp. LH-20]